MRVNGSPGLGVFFALAAAVCLGAGESPPAPSESGPQAAFDRFKRLEGMWRGESTKGWTEDVTFKVIAGGSAVMETSFDAHPNETMLTLFSMDGERLRLTHYCVARNQPRLQATSIDDGGRSVTFEFVDGGNIASRDQGHMDRAVFRFEDADHVTTRWTWFEGGKERWLEEIRLTRKR